MPKVLQSIFYTIWITIGIVVLVVALKVYQDGPENYIKTFFQTAKNEGVVVPMQTSQPVAAASPSGQQTVTPQQLDCIKNAIGAKRTDEITKGGALTDQEKSTIQPCLASATTQNNASSPIQTAPNAGANQPSLRAQNSSPNSQPAGSGALQP